MIGSEYDGEDILMGARSVSICIDISEIRNGNNDTRLPAVNAYNSTSRGLRATTCTRAKYCVKSGGEAGKNANPEVQEFKVQLNPRQEESNNKSFISGNDVRVRWLLQRNRDFRSLDERLV